MRNERWEAVAGTLAIGSGSLNRSGNPDLDATVTASATGTLTQGSESVELGTELEGDFLGSGAEAIGGAVVGVATFGSTRRDFDGGFIAAQ